MTRSFSYALPGSMYEVSPDYGMIVQAWNIFSYAVPIVEQFFGIYPEARHNIIRLSPSMPTSWDTAAISDVRVLDGTLSLKYKRQNDRLVLDIDWSGSAELHVEFPEGQYGQWQVEGEDVSPDTSDGKDHIRLASGEHRLVLSP
jgi:hypothetical protein